MENFISAVNAGKTINISPYQARYPNDTHIPIIKQVYPDSTGWAHGYKTDVSAIADFNKTGCATYFVRSTPRAVVIALQHLQNVGKMVSVKNN